MLCNQDFERGKSSEVEGKAETSDELGNCFLRSHLGGNRAEIRSNHRNPIDLALSLNNNIVIIPSATSYYTCSTALAGTFQP